MPPQATHYSIDSISLVRDPPDPACVIVREPRNLGRDLIDYRVLAILRGAGVPMSARGVLGFARQWLPELTACDVERALQRCEVRALAEPVDGETWRAL